MTRSVRQRYGLWWVKPPISHNIGQRYGDREIVARWSKKPKVLSHTCQKDRIIMFGGRAAKMGKISWKETFGIIGVKVRSLSRSKFWKFDPLSHLERTKYNFWSHASQKDRIIIFGCGAPKIGKNSWKKTFGPQASGSGVKCPFQVKNLKIWPVLDALWAKILIRSFGPWCDQVGPIQEFWAEESISLRSFTPVVHKVLHSVFYPFWNAPRTKILIRLFWPWCGEIGQIRKFWSGESISLLELYASGA